MHRLFPTHAIPLSALVMLIVGCDPGEEKVAAEGATSEVIDGNDDTDDGGSDDGGGSGDSGNDSGSDSGDDGEDGTGDDGGDGTGDDGGDGTGDDGGDDGSTGSAMDIATEDLIGFTWQLDLATSDITEPPGIGIILSAVLTDSLMYGVTDATPDTLDLAVAVGRPDGAGFEIGDVLPLGTTDFSTAPDFTVDGTGTTLDYPYEGVDIPFEDPVFVGTMATDGESLDTITLTTKLDTRDVGPLFSLGSEETAVCVFMADFGVSCGACNDGEPLCLDLVAEWTNAPLIEGIVLE
jgi:hypothetical protein